MKGELPVVNVSSLVATAAHLLGVRLAIPIHYKTFMDDHYIEYPDTEETFRKEAKAHNVETRFVEPGDWLEW